MPTPAKASQHALNILVCGDLILDVEQPDHWLSGIAPAIQAADIAIGHLEVPHTNTHFELKGDVPAPGAPPENLRALQRAGFTAVSLAGNHITDCGPVGIADTRRLLDELGIAYCGAGANLAEARRPAILPCSGRTIGLLSYNCVGPEIAWATEKQAGCAYLKLLTDDGGPVTPKLSALRLCDETLTVLKQDIDALKTQVDLVIVSLHKGITHCPATLAPYEQPVAHATIDAGADVVLSHHAHIVQGFEFYKGRPVFHGLGNGCVVTRALSPGQDHPERAAWVERRKAMFGFEPDPAYELAPFHPEAVNAMLGTLRWHADGSLEAGMIPVHVEAPGRPVLANGSEARKIADYIQNISRKAGLKAFAMDSQENRVQFYEKKI
jgi:poly-gamma-glutamate capsule biosynthesis protein CapA/YwtB (metallophosphatase superfamily)